MKTFICVALAICAAARLSAQTIEPPPTASTPATGAEVEAFREEVRSLKKLVQPWQQQVKAQHPVTKKSSNPNHPPLPKNPEPKPAETATSPAPSASAPPLFPTTDTAV